MSLTHSMRQSFTVGRRCFLRCGSTWAAGVVEDIRRGDTVIVRVPSDGSLVWVHSSVVWRDLRVSEPTYADRAYASPAEQRKADRDEARARNRRMP
jgi:hypothetical protein